MNTTPVSLLEQLRSPSASRAWAEFVALYTPLLYHWAHRLGLDRDDAADLLQDVFLLLVRKLPEFRYDAGQRFRGWLWVLFVNRCRESRRRPSLMAQALGPQEVAELAAADEAEEWQAAEYRQHLVARAVELMQAEFHPSTWKACWGVVVEGRPAAEVGAELGLTANAVYVAKGRVLRRLRERLQGLID